MDPNAINTLISALGSNFKQADSNSKTFSDMLKDRRSFVENAANGVGGQIDSQLANGSNGANLSPAALKTPALSFGEGMTNKTTDLTNQMFGYNKQAQDALTALVGLMDSQGSLDVSRKNTSLNYQENGFADPYGSSGGGGAGGTGGAPGADNVQSNPVIQQEAQNIASGKTTPDKLTYPPAMKAKIIQQAYQMGYDPAKDINGLINGLETNFFNKPNEQGGSIAQGADAGNTIGNFLSQFLNNYTGGAIQGGAGKINAYGDYAKSVTPTLIDKLGITPDNLPKVTDSEATAKQKIANLRKAVSDKFYQGGQLPTDQGSASKYKIIKVGG